MKCLKNRTHDSDSLRLVVTFLLFVSVYVLAALLLLLCMWHLTDPVYTEKDTVAVFGKTDAEDTSKIVILDAGHGGEDGGTSSKSGTKEKELNLAVTLILADHLRADGFEVVLTRDSDRLLYDPNSNFEGRKKMLDLRARVEITERIAAEHPSSEILFVSIHMNAYPSENVRGLQVWYSPNDEIASKQLAETIQNRANHLLQPNNNRKVKIAGSNIYLLDHITIPAVLVECGFLSNEEDAKLLANAAYQKKLAFSLFSAITDHFSRSTSA